MLINSLLAIILLFASSEAHQDLKLHSEGLGNQLIDFFGKSHPKLPEPDSNSVPSEASLRKSPSTSNANTVQSSSEGNPSSMNDPLALRLSLGSQPPLQDVQERGSTHQATTPEELSFIPISGPALADPEGRPPLVWPHAVLLATPISSRGNSNYQPNHEAVYFQQHNPSIQKQPANPHKDFWKPKTVKVVTKVDADGSKLTEVEIPAEGGQKLQLRYPEEEQLHLQLENEKKNPTEKDQALIPLKVPFEFKSKVHQTFFEYLLSLYGARISHYGQQEQNGAPTKTSHRRYSYLAVEAFEQGKNELKELGLPSTLYPEPHAIAEPTSPERRQHFHTPLTPCASFKEPLEESLDHTGITFEAPFQSEDFNRMVRKTLKRVRENSLHPLSTTTSSRATQSTDGRSFKKHQLAPTRPKETLEFAKDLISYTLPGVIHEIRILCEAFVPTNAMTNKTIKQLQWDAWHFYYNFIKNIDLLNMPQIGRGMWESISIMPYQRMMKLVSLIGKPIDPVLPKNNSKVAPISRRVLALWMSCYCKILYKETQGQKGLSGQFVGILNELHGLPADIKPKGKAGKDRSPK